MPSELQLMIWSIWWDLWSTKSLQLLCKSRWSYGHHKCCLVRHGVRPDLASQELLACVRIGILHPCDKICHIIDRITWSSSTVASSRDPSVTLAASWSPCLNVLCIQLGIMMQACHWAKMQACRRAQSKASTIVLAFSSWRTSSWRSYGMDSCWRPKDTFK